LIWRALKVPPDTRERLNVTVSAPVLGIVRNVRTSTQVPAGRVKSLDAFKPVPVALKENRTIHELETTIAAAEEQGDYRLAAREADTEIGHDQMPEDN
jgi:hypothetical protein